MAGKNSKPKSAPAVVLRTEDVSAEQPKKKDGRANNGGGTKKRKKLQKK